MDTVISGITAWKDLIIKVFGQYPLSAAIVTLAAIGFYFYLEKKERPGKAPTNILIVLFVWAIAVPILGFILNILFKVWEFIEAVTPGIAKVLGSFYSIYDRHPFLVLALLLLAFIAYFVWKKWWPKKLPSRALRILALVIAVVLFAHALNPFANLFDRARPSSGSKAITPAPQPSPTKVSPVAPNASAPPTQPAPSSSAPMTTPSTGTPTSMPTPIPKSSTPASRPAGSTPP